MSKSFIIIIIVVLVLAGGGVWVWQNSKIPVVVEDNTPEVKMTAVSDFKNYEGKTLPDQFPKDFPNPVEDKAALWHQIQVCLSFNPAINLLLKNLSPAF